MNNKVTRALPCPFCGSLAIRYSLKVANSGYTDRYYHAQCYCTNCNTYGPRIKSKIVDSTYTIRAVQNDEELRLSAEKAWNTRVK